MVENTKIEWATHTFNPWIGCTKVGPGCDHCYAETQTARFKQAEWGPGQPRKLTSDKNWNMPLRWNEEAKRTGIRPRVFCASLADVFDNEVPPEWRARLWALIGMTPHIDWLLLTKRIGNVKKMLPECWGDGWSNVWLGITVVNQTEADRDIPKLLDTPARLRFLSMEPLLGPVNLETAWHGENALDSECWGDCGWCPAGHTPLHNCQRGHGNPERTRSGIDWVIVGGESGRDARPLHPSWVRGLRDQCAEADVPILFKQWGEFYYEPAPGAMFIDGQQVLDDDEPVRFVRVGKKLAGRELDGIVYDGLPRTAA